MADDQTYLDKLFAMRDKIISGQVLSSHEVGGKDRSFADPPSLSMINKEIQRVEAVIGTGTFVPRTYVKNGGRGTC